MEVQDRYRAELDAKFMQVVDMGFDPVEVRKVMDIYDPDLDTIVFVLKKVSKVNTSLLILFLLVYYLLSI